MSECKVVFARGTDRLEVEGTAEFVEARLKEMLPLLETTPDPEEEASDRSDGPGDGEKENSPGAMSLRSFITGKVPGNIYEAISCILYFNKKHRGKEEMTAEEIRSQLILARQRPPMHMAQAMTDCRRRYGYVGVGTKKGMWILTNDGEVTVDLDLPRNQKAAG
jgi:hypothetical protein